MMTDTLPFWPVLAPALVVGATATSMALIVALRPLLLRIALVRPNARSSHQLPTPQGGGAAVMAATVLAVAAALPALALPADGAARVAGVLGAAILLAVVGAVDDIRGLGALSRLLLQIAAVGLVLTVLPPQARVVEALPWWTERALLLLAGVWFVNLVNFMDGLDWMTVAEVVPVAGALVLAGAFGALPPEGVVVALALAGAMLGFAPFNRPVARLFLGDVGSLPVALLLAWLLFLLAAAGHLAAAVLLPLYYLADATLTLLRRLARRERVWEAHRSHFYQRAAGGGFTAPEIVARVFVLNLALAALALVTIAWPAAAVQAVAASLGAALVAALLHRFARAAAAPP